MRPMLDLGQVDLVVVILVEVVHVEFLIRILAEVAVVLRILAVYQVVKPLRVMHLCRTRMEVQ